MRLALIADVHGNIDALNAALDDARARRVDGYALLGDYIFDMPFSQEVADVLRALPGAHIIKGNKEGYIDDLKRQCPQDWTAEQMGVIYRTFEGLSAPCRDWLSALPKSQTIELPSGRRLHMVHDAGLSNAHGRNEFNSSGTFSRAFKGRAIDRDKYTADIERYLSANAPEWCRAAGADIVAFGHYHLQGCGSAHGLTLINPGACGQPLDGVVGAPYAILDDGDELRVELHRAQYDVDAAIARARTTAISRAGAIWSELVWRSLRTGRDNMALMFDIAREVASERGQRGGLYSNDTWRAAYARFEALYGRM